MLRPVNVIQIASRSAKRRNLANQNEFDIDNPAARLKILETTQAAMDLHSERPINWLLAIMGGFLYVGSGVFIGWMIWG